jgi:hypothetical protein
MKSLTLGSTYSLHRVVGRVIDLIHTDHYLPLTLEINEVVTITMEELLKAIMALFAS